MGDLFGHDDTAGAGPYVRVAVERSIDGTGQGLTYRAGTAEVRVGQRVEVPLGRGNRAAAGVVVVVGGEELLEGIPPSKIKRVLKVSAARLPERLVELARWLSEYYHCPLGMTLATMMPAAVKHGIGVRRLVELEPVDAGRAAAILETNHSAKVEETWNFLSGLGLTGAVTPEELKARLGTRTMGPINKLVAAGLLRRVEREVVKARTPLWDRFRVESPREGIIELTGEQARAVAGVVSSLGGFGVHLLRGVTGSGKTEVYLRVIDHVIARGQTALVLVPEISLTPQTAGRFMDRFARGDAGTVAVLHSGLTAAERHRQWALAASPYAKIVVGARSAVFAPLNRVGVIVVDEEHATDYKQDQLPRYHGRDVAIKRGQLEGCPVVLGSATPSLESWANAIAGRYTLWELTQRVGGGAMPRVQIVDLAEERKQLSRQGGAPEGPGRFFQPIGPQLASALARTLEDDGQAILLLNRRGYSNYICCPDAECGWVMKCDHCDASMVVHKLPGSGVRGSVVRCHHCLAEQMVPRKCPVCSRPAITLGVGTQKLEEELGRMFGRWLSPGKTLIRVDGDTMKSAADYFEVLARFAKGEVRVLLGTQMIAKGLDYPNVRLVGVINADTGLSLPDFRSAERTFQLVSQVAGRAGRGEKPGLVIVQTASPQEPALLAAEKHDYRGFAEKELELRQRAGLPPARRMARIVVRDEDFGKAQSQARELAKLLNEARTRDVVLLGPGPAPVSRIGGFFRFSIEIIAPTAQELHAALAKVRAKGLLKSDAHTAVDVDPVALM